jgi:hypothetical protein
MPRFAHPGDVERVVSLARVEHARSPWADTPFDATAAEHTVRQFMVMMGRTLIVSPGGYLAGMVQPFGFSRGLMAIEYAWFAADGTGMELLDMFEDWARCLGCRQVLVHDHVTGGRVAHVLHRRRGYQSLGSTLARTLET